MTLALVLAVVWLLAGVLAVAICVAVAGTEDEDELYHDVDTDWLWP